MSDLSKKIGLFISMLILNMCMTGIAPFFPGAADKKGFPTWLIGMVFSVGPFSSFIFASFVPRLLERFGRRSVIISGTISLALGKSIMSIMILNPLNIAIFLSFLGRSLVGVSHSLVFITIYTTLTSDYPDETTKMVSILEIIAGVGISIGPTFGAAMFAIGGYIFACLSFAVLNIITIPVLILLMKNMRKYEIVNSDGISMIELISKPKIGLDFGMQFFCMFSMCYLYPTLEFHLEGFGLSETQIGFFFSITTFSYLVSSVIITFLPAGTNKPRVMLLGVALMAVGFVMTGPSKFLFPNSLIIIIFGLALIGFAGGLMYVYTVPNMLEMAEMKYGYVKDDRLYDALSGVTSASLCFGEVVGPTVSSIIYSVSGFETSTDIACLVLILSGILYGVFSDSFRRFRKSSILVKSVNTDESD